MPVKTATLRIGAIPVALRLLCAAFGQAQKEAPINPQPASGPVEQAVGKGAGYLRSRQRPDGSWDAGSQGTSGPVPDTCFAILFLKRAAKPIVSIPERPTTGDGLFGQPKK